MKQELLTHSVIHADETVVQVLKEEGKPPTSASRMWLYASGALQEHQVRLFEYQPDRSDKRPENFLKGFEGALVTDGYAGYNQVAKVTHCGVLGACEKKMAGSIFAFHIHDGHVCTGNENDPFADAGRHLNPAGMPHPSHAGDLPPLFENRGYAYMKVFTNRFRVEDIIGHVVIIHEQPDDFTAQLSGNSGAKIACGKIAAA